MTGRRAQQTPLVTSGSDSESSWARGCALNLKMPPGQCHAVAVPLGPIMMPLAGPRWCAGALRLRATTRSAPTQDHPVRRLLPVRLGSTSSNERVTVRAALLSAQLEEL